PLHEPIRRAPATRDTSLSSGELPDAAVLPHTTPDAGALQSLPLARSRLTARRPAEIAKSNPLQPGRIQSRKPTIAAPRARHSKPRCRPAERATTDKALPDHCRLASNTHEPPARPKRADYPVLADH